LAKEENGGEMIQDALLEYSPQWEAIDGPGIGGPVPFVAPKTFTVTPATAAYPYLTVVNAGGDYTDMMAATHRPLMPTFYADAIYYDFVFDITVDPNHPTQSQADESEASYCWVDSSGKSWYCNNSLQVNNEAGGMIQAYQSPSAPWANTGIIVPKFTPNVACSVVISYLIDTVKKVYSTLGISVNGKYHPLPASFQNLPAENRPGWEPGVYTQFQLDLASKGGTLTPKYNNISINWL
jgi:hypothetical protein